MWKDVNNYLKLPGYLQLSYIQVSTSLHTEEKMLKLENAVHFCFQSRQG